MTAYSMTITNSVNAFGAGPTTMWGSANWNEFSWGAGTAPISKQVVKGVTNSLSPTSAMLGFRVVKLLTSTLTPLSSVNYRFFIIVTNSLTADGEVAAVYSRDGAGYTRVFAEDVTNMLERTTPTWTPGAAGAGVWTTATAGSTTWSDA